MFHCSNHLEWFEIRLLVGYCNPYMFGRRNSNHYIVLGSIPSSGSRILLVYIYIFPILYIIVFPPTTIIFSHYNCHIYISLPKPLFFNSIFPVQCAKNILIAVFSIPMNLVIFLHQQNNLDKTSAVIASRWDSFGSSNRSTSWWLALWSPWRLRWVRRFTVDTIVFTEHLLGFFLKYH